MATGGVCYALPEPSGLIVFTAVRWRGDFLCPDLVVDQGIEVGRWLGWFFETGRVGAVGFSAVVAAARRVEVASVVLHPVVQHVPANSAGPAGDVPRLGSGAMIESGIAR